MRTQDAETRPKIPSELQEGQYSTIYTLFFYNLVSDVSGTGTVAVKLNRDSRIFKYPGPYICIYIGRNIHEKYVDLIPYR